MARIDPRRAKLHRSYTVAEAARLFEVHRNTVRHWVKGGLPVVRAGRLVLILGRDLGPFLVARRAERQRKCGRGQLYCLRCREPRRPREGTLSLASTDAPTVNVVALCEACGARMHRRVSVKDLAVAGFDRPKVSAGG